MLALEVGFNQSAQVAEILRETGLHNVETKEDINAVQRVVFGTVKTI